MENKTIRRLTLSDLKDNWGSAILILILLGVLSGIVQTVASFFLSGTNYLQTIMMMENIKDPAQIQAMAMNLASQVFGASIGIGLITGIIISLFDLGINFGFLDITHGKPLMVEHLFSAFNKDSIKYLVTLLLKDLIIIFATVLLIIPGIIMYYAYQMVPYLLKTRPELSILDTLKESRRLMKGKKFKLFKLIIPYVLVVLLVNAVLGGVLGFMIENEMVGGPLVITLITMILFNIIYSFRVGILQRALPAEFFTRDIMAGREEDLEDFDNIQEESL